MQDNSETIELPDPESAPQMLIPVDNVLPVLKTRFFALSLSITVVLTVLINGLIDHFMKKSEDNTAMWSKDNLTSIFVTNIIFAVLIVLTGTGGVRKEILQGRLPPVERDGLNRGFFCCLPLAINWWPYRLLAFIILSIVGTGVLTVVAVYGLCDVASKGFSAKDPSCYVSHDKYVVYTELWKGIDVAIICVLNFIASCNYDQPELSKERDRLLMGCGKQYSSVSSASSTLKTM